MINIEIDGIWCGKCKKFHPTLNWHKKYGKEETKEGMAESLWKSAEKRPKLFGLDDNMSMEKKKEILDEIVELNLGHRKVCDAEVGTCVICGEATAFISEKTGRHVCSDECLYRENGWEVDAYS